MAQPSIIVFSSADVEYIPMLSDNNAFTGDNSFAGTTTFQEDIILDSDSYSLILGEDADVEITGTGAGALTIAPSAADTDMALTFFGTTHSGLLTWMEDEDYFKFSDSIFMNEAEPIYFGDTNTLIYWAGVGLMNILATNGITLTTDALNVGKNTTQDNVLTFQADPNDGVITWKRTEDYFQFSDDILFPDNEAVKFGTGVDASIAFNGSGLVIQSDVVTATDYLQLRGGTNGIDFNIGATEQVSLIDGVFQPTTTNDIDLGTSSLLFKDIWEVGKHYFRDSAIYISSESDTQLNLTADGSVEINSPMLNVTEIYSVNGFDCGDVGGFSGIKWNAGATTLDVYIDGSKIGHFAADGTYNDDV